MNNQTIEEITFKCIQKETQSLLMPKDIFKYLGIRRV